MKSWVKKAVKVLTAFFAVVMFVGAFMALSNDGAVTALAADEPIGCDKDCVPNGDGTYTLSLSVTGASETSSTHDVTKTNVIIVMDTSNSMTQNNTYVYTAGTGNNANYGYNSGTNTYFRVYRHNDGQWYTQQYGGTVYNGTRYVQSSMTRLDAEQAALGTMVHNLLLNNTEQDQGTAAVDQS